MNILKPYGKITIKNGPFYEDFFQHTTKSGGINSEIKKEYLIARLLLLLKDFHDSVHAVQAAIHYKGPYDELTAKEFGAAKKGVKKIMQKFYLTPNWEHSVIDVITMNILKVPLPLKPIYLETNDGYPSIRFTHKISITKLRGWINDNQIALTNALSKLPEVARTKIDSKTIFWGQIVALGKLKGKSYSDIIKELDKEIDEGRLEDLEKLAGLPNEKDLDNSYKALTIALSKHFKIETS